MANTIPIKKAARIIRGGGVVAYPTEGVFGLGCLPDDFEAVSRVLAIKKRDPAMGLLLIAASVAQLGDWIDLQDESPRLESTVAKPVTWIVPASDKVPYWIRGEHDGVAVRVTAHLIAANLCRESDSPLVSTSSNLHGRPPARNAFVLRRTFGGLVDYIVPGRCGPAAGPSEIRDFTSGKVLRPA